MFGNDGIGFPGVVFVTVFTPGGVPAEDGDKFMLDIRDTTDEGDKLCPSPFTVLNTEIQCKLLLEHPCINDL